MTHQLTNLHDIAITRNLTVAFDTIILIDANCTIKTSADGAKWHSCHDVESARDRGAVKIYCQPSEYFIIDVHLRATFNHRL